MDYFNIDLTLKYIEASDKKLIDEMDSITFEYNKLYKEGDKLLQILNYSPKVAKPDKNMINRLPKITIPQLSELKNLDFSLLNSNVNNQIISTSIKDNEKFDMVKSIVTSIIDNILEKKTINNIIKTDDYDEDEEFEKLLIKNRKQSEEEEKKRDSEFTAAASRLGLEMNLSNQLKVYLFNNDDYILINITPKDKIKSIKEKIIKKILDNKKFKLKSTSEEAYEIRLIEEDNNDKFVLDSSPLENNESIFKEKIKSIAFLENKNYISTHINEDEEDIKIDDEEEEKVNVKIYYKKNGLNNSKILVLSKDEILKNVLNTLLEQNILKNKNINQYYFVEHNAIQDIENEINLDTNIKYLPSYELNLCLKDYYEIPEMINEYNIDIKKGLFNSKNDDKKGGGETSRFNEISGGLYQEFEVYKINKYKIKKKRILGIDMYNLYNNFPKKNNSGIMNILFNETKHPMRKIEDVVECIAIGDNRFCIDIKEENKEQIKKLNYEVKNIDIRDEIVDKLNFLINYHKNNN